MGEASLKENGIFEIELQKVPITWDLDKGGLSFFGLDSALFWTAPSLVHMLAPLAEEIGNGLFRLLIAYSSSLGTKEDFHNMVSSLGDNFEEGFLAWGKAVSAAGWGTFEMPEYNPDGNRATVIVHNSWELSAQRHLSKDRRWGAPFIQGKIIGIFGHAFGRRCWADDICNYDSDVPYVTLNIFPAEKTIRDELQKMRYDRMVAREQELEDTVRNRTAELVKAKGRIEEYSKTLEQMVAMRTDDLVATNKRLGNEIEIRKKAERRKEMLIDELKKALNEVKTLRGLLPMCTHCKKIRDDKGYWNIIESYILEHSDAEVSHSLCPDCFKLEMEKIDKIDPSSHHK
jgi:hypothetical protein